MNPVEAIAERYDFDTQWPKGKPLWFTCLQELYRLSTLRLPAPRAGQPDPRRSEAAKLYRQLHEKFKARYAEVIR